MTVSVSLDQRHERNGRAMQTSLAHDPAPRMTATQLLKSWRGWRMLHAGEHGDIRARRTAAVGSVDVCRDGAIY
jgi:hypothetical protein